MSHSLTIWLYTSYSMSRNLADFFVNLRVVGGTKMRVFHIQVLCHNQGQ